MELKALTLVDIVNYFTYRDGSEEYSDWFCDCARVCGYDLNVPVPIQGCVNCYVFCEPGEQAAHWFNEVCKRIGYER